LNNWIDISATALAANYRVLEAAADPHVAMLAVIKANAYGHGAGRCGVTLAHAGAPWLGVTCASEGMRVRQALDDAEVLIQPKILVMCGALAADTAMLFQHRLTPTVWTKEQVHALPPGMRIHVEVDTGMSRQGVPAGDDLNLLLCALADKGLLLDGVYTHFSSAEELPPDRTHVQQERFARALEQVMEAGLQPAWIHTGNTSTVDNPAQPWPWLAQLAARYGARPMVRSGLGLYGYALPINAPASFSVHPHIGPALTPVMTWRASVLSVRSLAAGESIGYNATYTAPAPMRVALLPVGYADGLRRELSSTRSDAEGKPGGWVILHGQRARILGRISMNLTVVDVSAIDGVRAGDEAILLGPGITADDHAHLAGTIAYEILCGIHPCG
jgi:alanine racemase